MRGFIGPKGIRRSQGPNRVRPRARAAATPTLRSARKRATGSEAVKQAPWASRDGVSTMGFEAFDRRRQKVTKAAAFGTLAFSLGLASWARGWGRSGPREAACAGGHGGQARFPGQAKPLLKVVGEACPQDLAAGFFQPPHAELPQSEFGLQPQVAEFRHWSPPAIGGARLHRRGDAPAGRGVRCKTRVCLSSTTHSITPPFSISKACAKGAGQIRYP